MRKIDFEAHFLSPTLRDALSARESVPFLNAEKQMVFGPDCELPYGGIWNKLEDVAAGRIKEMDEAGIDIQVISCTSGAELLPSGQGEVVARESNDYLFSAIQAYPDRFRGYATLAPQNVSAAVYELERCVKDLGFIGWNTFSNFGADALDDPRYFPLLEKAAELGALIYIHPAMSTIERLHGYGRQLIASGLGFGIDVMITTARMIFAGIFDRLPELTVLLGHLGEGFPFVLDRLRSLQARQSNFPAVNELPGHDYFKSNIMVTTSGKTSVPALRCALDTMGVDRVLLASDYPFENQSNVVDYLSGANLAEDELNKICWENAKGLI